MHRAVAALMVYVALLLAPLGLSHWMAHQAGWALRPWRDDLASGLGMVGLAALCVEFVLLGRFKPLSRSLPSDGLMQAHQVFARTAALLLLAHPFVYSLWGRREVPWDADHALALRVSVDAWGLVTGLLALGLLGALVVHAVYRDSVRYERWRALHALGALAVVALGLHHTLTLGRYAQLPVVRALWWVLVVLAVASLAWVHGARPLLQRRQRYRLVQVRRAAERLWALEFAPPSGPGLAHRAGQFAWLRLQGASTLADHPLSIASAPRADGTLRFLVKEAGDFTRGLDRLQPGQGASLDGPYGCFGGPTDAGAARRDADARPVVMLAGGIGVAPFVALLEAATQAADTRALRLVYADRDAGQQVDVAALVPTARLRDFELLRVLEHPSPAPAGTFGQPGAATLQGRLDAAGLQAVLAHPAVAPLATEAHFLVCGPPPMMDAVETALLAHGVPPERIHAEHFRYDFAGRSPLAQRARTAWLFTSAALLAGIVFVLALR
jgi:predicted ferric reductase